MQVDGVTCATGVTIGDRTHSSVTPRGETVRDRVVPCLAVGREVKVQALSYYRMTICEIRVKVQTGWLPLPPALCTGDYCTTSAITHATPESLQTGHLKDFEYMHIGICPSHYLGGNPTRAATLEGCAAACLLDNNCQYFAVRPGHICSRYGDDAAAPKVGGGDGLGDGVKPDCDVNTRGESEHWLYKRRTPGSTTAAEPPLPIASKTCWRSPADSVRPPRFFRTLGPGLCRTAAAGNAGIPEGYSIQHWSEQACHDACFRSIACKAYSWSAADATQSALCTLSGGFSTTAPPIVDAGVGGLFGWVAITGSASAITRAEAAVLAPSAKKVRGPFCMTKHETTRHSFQRKIPASRVHFVNLGPGECRNRLNRDADAGRTNGSV